MLDQIANGRTDLVRKFVENAGSPEASIDGASLLQWCAYYGDVSAIRYLRDRGSPLETLGANLGLTGAAFHGDWQLCEYLVEEGADPRYAMPDTGETALHSALCSAQSARHERVVEVLLAAGADPNAATIPGVETGAFMRDVRTRAETSLHRAAAFGTLDAIKALVDAGAARDAKDANGDTPLTWASWALRNTQVLQLLCYPPFKIDPARQSMASNLIGRPASR